MHGCSNTTLTFACIASLYDKSIEIRNIRRIRHHKSDQISAIFSNLTKLGVRTTEYNNGLKVFPSRVINNIVDSYDDHRIVIAISILAVSTNGAKIINAECVS